MRELTMVEGPINEAPDSLGSRWHVRDLVVTYPALSLRYWLYWSYRYSREPKGALRKASGL